MQVGESKLLWPEAQKREIDYWVKVTKKGEKVPFKSMYRFHEILSILSDVRNLSFDREKIIDIGSGPKCGILPFLNGGFKVAIDPLFKVRNIVDMRGNVNPLIAVTENLPLENDSFDVIFSVNMLDHTKDPSLTIKEIYRITKKGGIVSLMVHIVPPKRKVVHKLFHSKLFIKKLLLIPPKSKGAMYVVSAISKILSIILMENVKLIANDGFMHPHYFTWLDVLNMIMDSNFSVLTFKLKSDPSKCKLGLYVVCKRNYA
jgi:SAM-dependent methyltransferase